MIALHSARTAKRAFRSVLSPNRLILSELVMIMTQSVQSSSHVFIYHFPTSASDRDFELVSVS